MVDFKRNNVHIGKRIEKTAEKYVQLRTEYDIEINQYRSICQWKKHLHQIACNKNERKYEIDVSNEKRALIHQ